MSAFKNMKNYTEKMEEIENQLKELHDTVGSDPILIKDLQLELKIIKGILDKFKKRVNSHHIGNSNSNYPSPNPSNNNNFTERYGGSKRKSNRKSKKQSKKVKSKKIKK